MNKDFIKRHYLMGRQYEQELDNIDFKIERLLQLKYALLTRRRYHWKKHLVGLKK